MSGKHKSPQEMLQEVKDALEIKRWGYSFTPHQWFRPDDVMPHSPSFKYICKKLHGLGLLERRPTSGRWGYFYRVPSEVEIEL